MRMVTIVMMIMMTMTMIMMLREHSFFRREGGGGIPISIYFNFPGPPFVSLEKRHGPPHESLI